MMKLVHDRLALVDGHLPPLTLRVFRWLTALGEMVPDGGRLISAKPIVLDGERGGMLLFEQTLQRLDLSMTVRGLNFITVRSGKMIFIQCMVYMRLGEASKMQERFGRFEPVFRLIGHSFVLHDRYK